MRKQGSTIAQRVVAVVMSVVMAFSLLVASPREAQAGLVVNILGCNWTAIAKNAVERTLLWGIGKAEAATNSDTLASVLSMTKRIIAGKSGIIASQTLQEVKHISAQLSALFAYTVDSTQQIEDMIADLASNDYKNEFNDHAATPVDNFTGQYNYMVHDFNDLIDAYVEYGEDPSDMNRTKLETCYNVVYNSYYRDKDVIGQIDDLFTTPLMGDSSTTGFLPLISPYNPKQDILKADDMTNPDVWEMRSVDTHFLRYYYDYITSVTDFQNNVYDSMCAAASIVDNAAYVYLQAYRYYCEFGAMLLASDASLSEQEQRSQTSYLWEGFYNAAHMTVRGINQMYNTYEPVFTTYMRTYDVVASKRINNYKSPITYYELLKGYEDDNGYSGVDWSGSFIASQEKELTMDIIKEYQNVYQFRLVSDPSLAYAIRSSTNSSSEEDGVSRAFYSSELQTPQPGNSYSGCTHVNPEVYTLLKGLEGGYAVPVHMSELGAISSWKYYYHSGLLTDNIRSELAFGLGNDNVHLPEVVSTTPSMDAEDIVAGPSFLILRSDFYVCMEGVHNKDARGVFGNVSMTYDAAHEAELDLEDEIADFSDYLSDKETVTMWTGEPQHSLSVSSSGGGEASVSVGDDQVIASGQSATLSSGTAMTVRVLPSDGNTIDSVSLLDRDGNVLENILGDMATNDDETISVQEQLKYIDADADGAYSFTLPMAYRNVTVQATFKPIDQSLLTHQVVLNDVEVADGVYDAVCQFGSYDYLSAKSFKAGDQVVVSVVGYDHHIANGLTITNAAGEAVDVAYEDVSDEMQCIRPTERLYTFTMPDQDVMVTPVLGASHAVAVVNDKAPHVTHKFENLNLLSMGGDTDWAYAKTVDFEAGDTISISYTANVGYYVSGVKIVDANYNIVPSSIQQGKIVFTMPNVDVAVGLTESAVDLTKHMLTLDPNLEGVSFQFVEKDGSTTSLTQRQYNTGEEVQVKAVLSNKYTYDGMLLTANGSTDNLFEAQGGTYDPETGLVTFTMPDANVTLSAKLPKKSRMSIDSALEGAQLQFVDEDGNAVDATEWYAAPNETVRARIQVTDDALSVERMTLTADGGDGENLFEAQGGTFDRSSGMVTFLASDADAMLGATLREKTPAESDGFDTDADDRILVHTYEDLVKFSDAIRQNSDFYSVQDLVLTNNIDANGKDAWQQGIGDDFHEIAYNGTFEGNGYCIFGMDFAGKDETGLFEVLGQDGVVRNLFMFDCDSLKHGQFSCSIAVYNYGRIEHCTVGANLANTVSVDFSTGALVSQADSNSYIYGWGIGAGIADYNENSGIIYACRSAAEIVANISVGGIAGDNNGTISNCVSNSSLSGIDTNNDTLGGIAGMTSRSIVDSSAPGLIEGGYSSALIALPADDAGSITGMQFGEIIDTYYTTSEGQVAFSNESSNSSTTNIQGLDREEMVQDSFVELLGAMQSNDVTWIRSDGLNDGLPRIMNTSEAFADVELTSNGVSARGNVHASACLAVSLVPSDSEVWQLLAAGGDDGKSATAYACDIRDAYGNQIPAELWVQSALTYTVPVSSEDVDVAVMLADGSVRKLDDVDVAQSDSGYQATFTSDYAVAFMVFGEGEEPKPDDGFDRDDDGRILVSTYEELVKFSQLVRLTPADYAAADVVLTNNINATNKETWAQGIGSQADNILYDGTFDGNGYCIFGMDVSASGSAGLFEVIGSEGVVKNLFLYDCDFQTHASTGGGIAARNYGRIEYCVNGVNLSNGIYVDSNGQVISLKEYNSVVDAGAAGGIVGSNHGTVFACRSAAVVRGDNAGSIAGENNGTVSNCAGNGSVSSDATMLCDCGGLVGANSKDGVVEAGYSSATISSTVPYCGSIAGAQLGSVADTYYTTSDDQQPFGTPSESSGTNINGLRRGEMMEDSFLDLLSAVGSNSVTWIRHDSLNTGLPRIKNTSAAFADVTLTGENIVVKGNLHTGASVAMTTISSESEAWKALAKNVDGYTAVTAYSTVILDDASNKIPDELWAQSALTYTVPVPGADVAIKVLDRNGNTKQLDDVTVDKADTGYQATFTADGVGAILVLQKSSGSDSGSGGTGNGGGTAAAAGTTTVATRTASTGDDSLPTAVIGVIAAAAVLLIACGLVWRRRSGGRQ